jgi:galactonate dehydratase
VNIILCRLDSVRVTKKTVWLFITLTAEDGSTGVGEASLNGQEEAVQAALRRMTPAILQLDAQRPEHVSRTLAYASLPEAAVVSAVSQALWDLCARSRGITVAEALGGMTRGQIPLYANINRSTEARTPEGFAATALAAVTRGFTAVKLAPFDEAQPGQDGASLHHAIDLGLARTAAVRDAIGTGARLMVDCHWRFDEAGASQLIHAARDLNLYWIECPISESPDDFAALRRLRAQCHDNGVRLAGAEQTSGLHGFRPLIEAGIYDVMMPDVKYAGGLDEMLEIAHAFNLAGIDFSPHNPTGPICHAASLNVSAAVPHGDLLEMQFDETPVFDELVAHGLPPIVNGQADLSAQGSGLGVALLPSLLSAALT